ncbi:hypothetical protein VE04_04740 [Pseudogymnoascus sp. 24MN13]|nr:hypothetical protein VE04_04740 [Pseudogymnoascus sp. 24MN13]
MPSSKGKILVIGGTGAQGVPVVKSFAPGSKHAVRVLTRDASSSSASELAAIPGVEIFEGNSYDEATLRKAFVGIDYAFVNTNGFAIGEKAEIYWGIRMYELAREFGLKHFIYAGLEYASKLGNFDPKYRCGHLDGKAKVTDYLSAHRRPRRRAPLGTAKCPLIYLKDYGDYARWMLDTPARSNGLVLHVATEDISWKDLTAAFTEVTGIKFRGEGWAFGYLPTLFTIRENYSGFWNTWKDELTKRDFKLLDEILPTRVKSVKEWMKKTEYKGESAPV